MDEGIASGAGITATMEKKRVIRMCDGEEAEKVYFTMQTKSQARNIISQYTRDQKLQEQYLEIIGTEQVTGFQLIDIFDAYRHHDRLLFEIKKQVKENLLYKKGIFQK
jgi:hypothetical protein